jgi:glycosyltransferase involved in cell wall biosynthesis
MNRKPRILLIPNVAWWIIGEMGKQIITRFGEQYEFYFLPEGLLERRPDLLLALVPAVDAIHCLNESSLSLFRDFDPESVPPIATWIHHVTTWSPDHQLAVDLSTALTVCTSEWKQYLKERVSEQVNITVVPHGVDTDFFKRRKIDRRRFGIPTNRFVLGFVGSKGSDSDHGRKGTDVFLDVARKAARLIPRMHILLGGPGWERELMELRMLGISASATGYIRKSDLPDLYSAFDTYLLTSRVEGGPCTVFEAMACETAVVSTRVGAVPELIVDEFNGYSAEVDDRESLLSAIVELEKFPEKRVKIIKNARETVSKRTWGSVLTPLEGVYDGLVQLRRTKGAAQAGPAWMVDTAGLLKASCAADALSNVINQVRKGSLSAAKGIGQLCEMLDRQSVVDILRGTALLLGTSFKTRS